MAKQTFASLKRRYLIKRNLFKKSNKSGGSSAAVEKAKKDLDPYLFLSWIDQYLKPRSTKSNISHTNYESSESMEQNEGVHDEDDKGSYPYMEESAYVNERKRQLPQSRKNSASNNKLSRIEEKQLKLMEEMEKDMKKEREQQENPVQAYCLSLASDLKMFNQMEQCMIKKEINDITLFSNTRFLSLAGQVGSKRLE